MNKLHLLAIAALIAFCSCNGNKADQSIKDSVEDTSLISDNEYDVEDEEPQNEDQPHVYTSDDGVVTIESDIYPGGGTAPDFWSRWKFKNAQGKECEVFLGDTPFVLNVHSIKKDDDSTYYLVHYFTKASSVDGYQWMEAFKIVGDTIEEVSVIDGGKKKEGDNDAFWINYNIPNWYFATDGEGYDWMFEYDTKTRNLYVPLTVGESLAELRPSDYYQLWHFNGKRFIDKGKIPH